MPSTRIALIRARYNPFGGAEKFVANAMTSLQTFGIKLTIVTRTWQKQTDTHALIVNPFYIGNVWRDWSFSRAVCKAVQQKPFDLVQSHERIPCCDIYRAGDGVHREWLKQRAQSQNIAKRFSTMLNPYHFYTCYAEKKLFQSDRLKAIICNSEMVKQEILHYFKLPHSKCHVIYSGVDINHFSPQLREKHFETFRKEYQIPGQAIVYLFVGSGFERKGVAPFLKALNQLPDHCYGLVVGADKHLDKYKSLTKKLGILDRVRFTGGLRATAPAYGAADVFVLPTLYDPFANVILEAMASGLPVITSFKSGGAEFIEDGVHGYKCHALDVNHLAKAMTHLQEVDIRTTMGKSAREKVLPFTFEAMSEKTDCFI